MPNPSIKNEEMYRDLRKAGQLRGKGSADL